MILYNILNETQTDVQIDFRGEIYSVGFITKISKVWNYHDPIRKEVFNSDTLENLKDQIESYFTKIDWISYVEK